jgi:hypothetical protein
MALVVQETINENTPLARKYKLKYIVAYRKLKKTPFWKFSLVKKYRDQMRLAQYGYKILTGGQININL